MAFGPIFDVDLCLPRPRQRVVGQFSNAFLYAACELLGETPGDALQQCGLLHCVQMSDFSCILRTRSMVGGQRGTSIRFVVLAITYSRIQSYC